MNENNDINNQEAINNNADDISSSKPSFSDAAKAVKDIGSTVKENKDTYKSKKNRLGNNEEEESPSNTSRTPNNSRSSLPNNPLMKNKILNTALDVGANFDPTLKAVKTARDLKNMVDNNRANKKNNVMPGSVNRKNTMASSNNEDNNQGNNNHPKKSNPLLGNSNDNDDDASIETTENESPSLLSRLGLSSKNGKSDGVFSLLGFGSLKSKLIMLALPAILILFFIIVIAAFIGTIVNFFSPLVNTSENLDGNNVAVNDDEREYYDNLSTLKNEYDNEGKEMTEFSVQIVTSTFTVIQTFDPSFSYKDMTLSRMKEVANLLFDSLEGEEGSYTLSSEEDVKERLADYFSNIIPDEEDSVYQQMANEVYDYVNAYVEALNDGEDNSSSSSLGGMCVYDVNGQIISNLKVRLMQAGRVNGHSCGGTYGEPMVGEELVDFEKYVLGVAYAEIGEAPEQAFKSQLIMARTFSLNRPSTMNGANGVEFVKEGDQWILQITNCVSDQVYCDPDRGCSKDVPANDQYGMMYSGTDHPNIYKTAIPQDDEMRKWASEVTGKIVVDSSGNLVNTYYNSTMQRRIASMSSLGYDYTDILVNLYGAGSEIVSSSCQESSGSYTNWKQNDPNWGSVKLGTSNRTISEIGCLTTSIAILIAKSDALNVPPSSLLLTSENLNPGTFAEAMNQNNGYDSIGLLNWNAVTRVVPSFQFLGKTSLRGLTKTEKLNTIADKVNSNQYCTVEVKGDTGDHWVAVDRIDGNNIYMHDPSTDATNMWEQYDWHNTSEVACFSLGLGR